MLTSDFATDILKLSSSKSNQNNVFAKTYGDNDLKIYID